MNIVILISGGGSTMERVIKECQSGGIPDSQVAHVIASNSSAGGIAKAQALGVPVTVLRPKADFNGDEVVFGEAIIEICTTGQVDVIAQLGWLAKTPSNVVEKFSGRIINQHPGILNYGFNDFGGRGMYGKVVHEATIRFMNKIKRPIMTEATVHLVTNCYDQGTIIGVRGLPVLKTDTADSLAVRLLPIEHDLVVEILRRWACGQRIEIIKLGHVVHDNEVDLYKQAIEEAKQKYSQHH
ncbi:MAG: formyltransferase family protein [Patescibacteria group bacterium]